MTYAPQVPREIGFGTFGDHMVLLEIDGQEFDLHPNTAEEWARSLEKSAESARSDDDGGEDDAE